MNSQQLDEQAILRIARQLPNPNDRSAYLDQVCSSDQSLRKRAESTAGCRV